MVIVLGEKAANPTASNLPPLLLAAAVMAAVAVLSLVSSIFLVLLLAKT